MFKTGMAGSPYHASVVPFWIQAATSVATELCPEASSTIVSLKQVILINRVISQETGLRSKIILGGPDFFWGGCSESSLAFAAPFLRKSRANSPCSISSYNNEAGEK
ncbi:hypothetical protein MN188_06125 [Aliiroseovarius sp. N1Y82]|uniref:hypothetical protein n=1 Tax=Aliiroseovarius subalbicans TaxID=2925840 RepID=UPI001F5AB314|nr:hypothetical protein [Aliiroseovarius subalbicans]MCI2398962.1 hypothetical protein [Aliiroseovarius subalbicans]